ncbi:MAG: RNA polymerase sigma factor [Patescibacteria group bacterium]|jgi:RNA polymerase sigma-70 factor (ECF subfamily)|nr:RNA polymerase sigma factor [Patescibacteria group bacterium]
MNEQDCLEKSDEELALLTAENQSYFLCIMKKYETPLMRYIRRISNFSLEEVEDVLQEVFIKVYQNINDFDKSLKFSSWIYRITHNHVISKFRKYKSRPEGSILEITEDELNNISSELDISSEVDAKINKEKLSEILNNIDQKYREVLILKFLEERDYKEISDIIKKPMGTVATLINRAKKKMAEEIEKQEIKF